jgi:hypothetical protein
MPKELQEEQVVESAETTTVEDLEVNNTSDDTDSEDEDATTTEGSEQQSGETPDQRRARIKRQYEREFGKQDKKGGQEGNKEEKEVDDRYERLELKTEGITSKKAQDVVLEYIQEAKLIGKDVDVSTALKSMVVREAIAEIAKKTSAPAPSNRTSTGASDTFAYWKAQAVKGNFPRHDKEMMAKLKKARIFTS